MIASYKRFVFREADMEGGITNHGTLNLWHRWREIALQGGLGRYYSTNGANEIKKIIKENEEQVINGIAKTVSGGNTDQTCLSFRSAIEQELSLLGKKNPQQT
uniref:Uncharacterized protein n=1 Tax=Helicotheca tamesis TaxID=374047 RepID=A0A7S2HR81_9STRA|mmetsp:Transcript_20384/g.27919  ORF Transcript_20384/g.27919 Transcript_20384/m.27919 type:complete len:103 (+) Transcript_20384:3-311(+)